MRRELDLSRLSICCIVLTLSGLSLVASIPQVIVTSFEMVDLRNERIAELQAFFSTADDDGAVDEALI